MMQYILQVVAFQLFFLMVYDLFLKRETFFNWNRAYLLGTSVLSFIIPFIKINSFKEIVPQEYVFVLPEVVIGSQINTDAIALPEVNLTQEAPFWTLQHIFIIGALFSLLLLIFKIGYITKLLVKNPKRWKGNIVLVKLLNSISAFSFLHYVFIGERLSKDEQEAILKHEMVHVAQKHSLDLLYFEVLRIVFWFNPLVYMYQNRIRSLHEFIADKEALKTQGKQAYYQSLLAQVFETQNVSFINTFFKKSLIRKRIVMLQKNRSEKINLLKYLFLVPMVIGMLVYTSSYGQDSSMDKKQETNKLVEKYYQELLDKEEAGVSAKEIASLYLNILESEQYILALDQYSIFQAFQKYISEGRLPLDSVEGLREKIINGLGIVRGDYSDYLAYKKSDKGIKEWEDAAAPYSLRIVLNDFDFEKMSPEEEKRYKEKENLLVNNDYYNKLFIAVGETYSRIEYDKKNPSLIPLDETKIEVPFTVVEEVPIFPGCETLQTNDEKKKCLVNGVTKHVAKKFNTDIANKLGLVGRQRIRVLFKINKEGLIEGVRARAPHPDLEAEAVRVVQNLPKMQPGKQRGKVVTVPYSLPIIFQVQDDSSMDTLELKEKTEENTKVEEDVAVPFAVVEEVPIFPGCEDLETNAERRKCMSNKISSFVAKKFNTSIADSLGFKGRQRISVIFKINKEGNVEGVRSRAPHPELEAEAIRVIKTFPKMKPGVQRGKVVSVPYSLPIIFEVASKNETLDEMAIVGYRGNNKEEGVVSYKNVDEPPVFKGCENEDKEEQRKCTSEKVQKYVQKNFDTNLASNLGLVGRQRISTMFKINKQGEIVDIKVRAPHPALEEETKRVISLIPKLIPGKHKGQAVKVSYALPIVFQVQDGKKKK
jgi:outer membrane biosynthesis protein TonB